MNGVLESVPHDISGFPFFAASCARVAMMPDGDVRGGAMAVDETERTKEIRRSIRKYRLYRALLGHAGMEAPKTDQEEDEYNRMLKMSGLHAEIDGILGEIKTSKWILASSKKRLRRTSKRNENRGTMKSSIKRRKTDIGELMNKACELIESLKSDHQQAHQEAAARQRIGRRWLARLAVARQNSASK